MASYNRRQGSFRPQNTRDERRDERHDERPRRDSSRDERPRRDMERPVFNKEDTFNTSGQHRLKCQNQTGDGRVCAAFSCAPPKGFEINVGTCPYHLSFEESQRYIPEVEGKTCKSCNEEFEVDAKHGRARIFKLNCCDNFLCRKCVIKDRHNEDSRGCPVCSKATGSGWIDFAGATRACEEQIELLHSKTDEELVEMMRKSFENSLSYLVTKQRRLLDKAKVTIDYARTLQRGEANAEHEKIRRLFSEISTIETHAIDRPVAFVKSSQQKEPAKTTKTKETSESAKPVVRQKKTWADVETK